MTAPRRRIWLYSYADHLEIVMLGQLGEIARAFAAVRVALERSQLFRGIEIVATGDAVGVMHALLNPIDGYLAPTSRMTPAYWALDVITRSRQIETTGISWAIKVETTGIVGTW